MGGHSAGPDWDRIQALFAKALERPAIARGSFLDSACAGDPELRAEVDSLLAAHDSAGNFLVELTENPAVPDGEGSGEAEGAEF